MHSTVIAFLSLVGFLISFLSCADLLVSKSELTDSQVVDSYFTNCGMLSVLGNYKLYYILLPLLSPNLKEPCGKCYKLKCVYDSNGSSCNTNYGAINNFPLYGLPGCASCNSTQAKLSPYVYDEVGKLNAALTYNVTLEESSCIDLIKGDFTKIAFLPGYSTRWFGISIINSVYQMKLVNITFNRHADDTYQLVPDKKSNFTFSLVKDSKSRYFYEDLVRITFPFKLTVVDTAGNIATLTVSEFSLIEKYMIDLNDRVTRSKIKFKSIKIAESFIYEYIDMPNTPIYYYYKHDFSEDALIKHFYGSVELSSGYSIINRFSNNQTSCAQGAASESYILNYIGLSTAKYELGKACDKCAEIVCSDTLQVCDVSRSPIIVSIRDECSSCSDSNILLSPAVFSKLSSSSPSKIAVKWKFVTCSKFTTKDRIMKAQFSSQSNSQYLSLVLSNFVHPIERVVLREMFYEVPMEFFRNFMNSWTLYLSHELQLPIILDIYDVNGKFGGALIEQINSNFTYPILSNMTNLMFEYTQAEAMEFNVYNFSPVFMLFYYTNFLIVLQI